jgi:2',3'-cyclic-nucleotide 2'-phosphodiesterase (5'-nucleotidase family)
MRCWCSSRSCWSNLLLLLLPWWTLLLLVLPPRVVVASGEEPNLPFGDVNVLILTDVHSWVGGHGNHEASMDADYGDALSFYERLKEYCDATDKDLWFVMNGDWIDGTGLAMDGDPSYLIPLLQKMPWDVVNVSVSFLR